MGSVKNVDDVPVSRLERGTFAHQKRALGRAAGGRKIGCSHMTVPPGKAAWPLHLHAANEEALFILQGRGRIRMGDQESEVKAGDYVALTVGTAHQLRNTSEQNLVYLAVSTMEPVDLTYYPDSDKFGFFAGSAPGGSKDERWLGGFHRVQEVEYWDGEDVE